jgi:predicted RNA methylase
MPTTFNNFGRDDLFLITFCMKIPSAVSPTQRNIHRHKKLTYMEQMLSKSVTEMNILYWILNMKNLSEIYRSTLN